MFDPVVSAVACSRGLGRRCGSLSPGAAGAQEDLNVWYISRIMRRPDSGIILVSECSEARMLARSALLGLSFFSILCPALIAAPQAPEGSGAAAPPQGSFVIRSTSRLVQVRVVVQDTKGEPITGLKSEDFTVLDEGRPQNIAVFSAETPVLPKLAYQLPNIFFTNRFDLKGQDPGSVTVILFDALNTSGPDLIYVRKHILNFLQTLKPQDRVAIYALTTQLLVLHEFTQDISALVSAASHFVPHESAGYDASNTEKVDLVGMTGDVDWLGFQNALNNANGMISDQSAINRAGTTSAAIEAIADHVATIPGPKSLIWVSAGFPIQIGTATIGRTDMANLTAGSGHDPRTSLGMGQHSPVGGGDATNELNRADREYESLAPVVNRGALALNRANMAIYPDHGKWNGKFREIKIRVKVDGARLRYRKGYIALAYHVASSKDIDTALQETAVSPLEATTLGMIVEGKLIEPLSAHNLQLRIGIDPKQLLLQDSHSHQKGSVDLLFVQRDSAGEILSAEKQHLDLNLPQAQYEFLAKAGMVLEHHMTINPQASEIRIVVSDAGSGALGSVTIPGKPFFETKTTPVAP